MRVEGKLVLAAALLCGGAASTLLGAEAWARTKAALARHLIDAAFEKGLADGVPRRPWGWADLRAVARLEVPRLDVQETVLTGSSGSTLAFGLGHVSGTAGPGERGHCVLSGHRDTHARFLEQLRQGDAITLVTSRGLTRYRLDGVAVVPRERTSILEPTAEDRLTLITCYPFRGLRASPWRYVVTAFAERGPGGGRPGRLSAGSPRAGTPTRAGWP